MPITDIWRGRPASHRSLCLYFVPENEYLCRKCFGPSSKIKPGHRKTVPKHSFFNRINVQVSNRTMTELSHHSSDQPAGADLLPAVRQFVLAQMNRRPDNRLVYHNYDFTIRLVDKTEEIAAGQSLAPEQQEASQLAAWFVALGYLVDYEDHTKNSQTLAARFLEAQKYPAEKRKKVLDCLRTLAEEKAPVDPEEQVLRDAYTVVNYTSGYAERSALRKLERELMTGRQSDPLEWSQLQLQRLLSARLYTHYARARYEGVLAQNIRWQKERVEKMVRKQDFGLPEEASIFTERFQGLEEGVPQRALQTFFRSNFRNHINLSAIADNKANIMISVNSILISVLITFLSYRNIGENNPAILLPVVIFIVSGAASLIFAVLSARPKVTNLNQEAQNVQKNIVFFGNFVHLDLDQYEAAMDAVFRSDELMYGNLTRDLYYLGKVLDKKYRYLSVSYTIFMIGFVTTVLTFLIILFT